MIPVIPAGAQYDGVWAGKRQQFVADQDRLAVPKGVFMELNRDAVRYRANQREIDKTIDSIIRDLEK
jgi:hypothetical protein